MGKMNPIILIQMLMQYHNYTVEPRTFKFTRNNRLRIHKETEDEKNRRKSILSPDIRKSAETAIRNQLMEVLKGRVGKVYVDPAMKSIAVPLQMSAAQTGFDVLPTGSRVKIPEGKKIRAFTYWEKVNDIDMSCFGLSEDGHQQEFSWRNMYRNQGSDITFSGDETSGYNGGSEYFDINLDLFKAKHPNMRYIIFCDNVFTGGGRTHFNDCFCKAGFMMRDEEDSGEIYELKAVKTSFRVSGDTSFNYMFAIDLETREMVWLNIIREGNHAIAGETKMDFLLDYLTVTEVFNVYDLFKWCGETVNVFDADLIVSDYNFSSDTMLEGLCDKEIIRSYEFEKLLKYIQPQ